MLNRENDTWTKTLDGKRIIKALVEAAKDNRGLFTSGLPYTSYGRPAVARLLREWGVPIVATRRSGRSAWFILTEGIPTSTQRNLVNEWERRIMADAYAEVCRAYMALTSAKGAKKNREALQSCAATLGVQLGYGLAEVIADLTPSTMPSDVAALLD